MTDETIRAKLSGIRCFLLDMDGTFYLGDRIIPGGLEFLDALEKTGRTARFLTNNSSRSASTYAEKLARMGVPAAYRDVITSGQAAARYCPDALSGQNRLSAGESRASGGIDGDGAALLRFGRRGLCAGGV